MANKAFRSNQTLDLSFKYFMILGPDRRTTGDQKSSLEFQLR